ncbi:class II fructose-bisphosphate aldolase [Ligilactobacillus sp. WILCCON 0076]|uniref:Class II fructose-bisphosphate aldolase n=1 Tax=Ligilactobacillus ubinensis TaxID=2876789 RepID=A0A9X2FT22_9LACO|nr:class II fructose-bisphosphate aldolase [Ligilactobacillus ubinensis]MCP0888033.1 class II fructose-bisphosphate aldolase [Ligilactobacillus ubinensis]
MLITSKDLLKNARENHYAFPHFNYWDSNSIRAEISAAEELNLPVILAWAEKHSSEISIYDALTLGKYFGSKAKVPVVLHLDHGTNPDLVEWGIENGFTSVMIDASAKSFDENVKITKEIANFAHKRGVVVESEIGHVGTNSTNDSSMYTEKDAALKFAELTETDSLAISIGTSHGVYKQGTPKLNFERLADIRETLPIPLVLHGGSSSGDENLNKAIRNGITKVNIYTDLANASMQSLKNSNFNNEPEMASIQRKSISECAKHYFKVFETTKYKYQV